MIHRIQVLLSNTEVDKHHLWLKPKKNKEGYDLLKYGPKGWRPLLNGFDLGTEEGEAFPGKEGKALQDTVATLENKVNNINVVDEVIEPHRNHMDAAFLFTSNKKPVFTMTILSATTKYAGLMSSSDKMKLEGHEETLQELPDTLDSVRGDINEVNASLSTFLNGEKNNMVTEIGRLASEVDSLIDRVSSLESK